MFIMYIMSRPRSDFTVSGRAAAVQRWVSDEVDVVSVSPRKVPADNIDFLSAAKGQFQ